MLKRSLPLARYFIAKSDTNKIIKVITQDTTKVIYHSVDKSEISRVKFDRDFVMYSDEDIKQEYDPVIEMAKTKDDLIRSCFAGGFVLVGWYMLYKM